MTLRQTQALQGHTDAAVVEMLRMTRSLQGRHDGWRSLGEDEKELSSLAFGRQVVPNRLVVA